MLTWRPTAYQPRRFTMNSEYDRPPKILAMGNGQSEEEEGDDTEDEEEEEEEEQ